MKDSFLLGWRALVRGRTLFLLCAAAGGIYWFMPALVRSDGSAAGAFEMYMRAVPGFFAAVVSCVALVAACGTFSGERDRKLLQLTLTRPVAGWRVALGRFLALVAVIFLALGFSSACLLAVPLFSARGLKAFPACRHHDRPTLPPPEKVAAGILEDYLRAPDTPEAVRKASRAAVLTLLTTKETDRYETVKPGERRVWPFDDEGLRARLLAGEALSVKVRFSTQFELRAPVTGRLTLGNLSAVVSNNTQAVLEIPLKRIAAGDIPAKLALAFENTGKSVVMVRPRRDVEVLSPADGFAWNLLRAQIETGVLASLLAAWGLFLSAALSRPVAVFTGLVTWLVVLMAPSVVTQFPDEFHATVAERLGLVIARAGEYVAGAVSAPRPVADLATSRAIPAGEVFRLCVDDLIVLPCILLALTAFVLRRKPLPDQD